MKRLAIASLATLAVVTASTTPLPAQANQPNMQAALTSLRQAKQSLEKAAHDKGGHRLKAIQLIDEAIDEVEAGIKAGG
jgi:predicted negative regulator of RcsB-dependent stress response